MVYATDDLRIDWNNDGDYSDTGENVTTRVIGGAAATIGRDQARAFSPIASGTIQFELNNRSKDYSPENGSSPIGANLKPGRPCRWQRTFASTTYTLFAGFTEGFTVQPNREERSVAFTGVDALARIRGTTISTALSAGIQTGDAVGAILDAVGWPSASRDIDSGATSIRYWWAEAEDALDALQKVVASEGSPALAYVDPATGNFVFRDRHHRITRSASSSSQATWRDTGAEPLFSGPMTYDAGWRDVVNDIAFEVPERVVAGVNSVVWSSDETITLAASAATTLHVQASDPFTAAVTPDATDYTVVSGAVASTSLSRTSGQSTIITITADTGGAVVRGVQLRARSVPVARTYKITASSSGSISDYGSRALPDELQPVWAGRADAQAVADLYVLQRAQRLPIVELEIRGAANSTRLTQCLTRKLSDRVTIVDAETGMNDDFFIETISHEVTEGGRRHVTRFGLEKAPTSPTSGFILGTSVLNTGLLGY